MRSAPAIIEETVSAIRQYYLGLTLSSAIVSVTIGLAMWLLGLPLAFTVMLVTFVTGYVPYLGAFVSGTFAFLVAVGAGGLRTASIVLVVILVAQNVIQTLVQNKLTSNHLSIHPLMNFASTIVVRRCRLRSWRRSSGWIGVCDSIARHSSVNPRWDEPDPPDETGRGTRAL